MTHETATESIEVSGTLIWLYRIATGMRQDRLAGALGISKSYLSHVEAGRRFVTEKLRLPMTYLLNQFLDEQETGKYQPENEVQQNAAILLTLHGNLDSLKRVATILDMSAGELLLKGANVVVEAASDDPAYHYGL